MSILTEIVPNYVEFLSYDLVEGWKREDLKTEEGPHIMGYFTLTAQLKKDETYVSNATGNLSEMYLSTTVTGAAPKMHLYYIA